MDLIIPLGKGSRWNNNELRYSLRSIEMYGSGIDDLWLIGEKPSFINCKHIQHHDGNIATQNIWNKVRAACINNEVSDPFLFSNDDFFFTAPFSSDYPNYYGNFGGTSSYKGIVHHTMNILQENNLGTLFYDVHRPMVIHKDAFLACYTFFEFYLSIGLGLVMKSCYGNYNEVKGTLIQDVKLAIWQGKPEGEMFSIADSCINILFKHWLQVNYPNPSVWEIC